MEISGIGAVVFIDTAGFEDTTELGQERIKKTFLAIEKTDIALILFNPENLLNQDYDKNQFEKNFLDSQIANLIEKLKQEKKPFILAINKIDLFDTEENQLLLKDFSDFIERFAKEKPIQISTKQKIGIENIKQELLRKVPEDFQKLTLTQNLCKENDVVLLVMPQDIQAPKGRLILPQVQIIRELLDKKCTVISCTTDKFVHTLNTLKNPPKLIITDSQVFKFVYENKPAESGLTSFSVLLAANKGDINRFVEGAKKISSLTKDSKVLIAEACTHAPLTEDIGTVKIPAMLKKFVGSEVHITHVNGNDFPKDLCQFDLIIHCGSCMFNRSYVLSRQNQAEICKIPMTNYGIAIAYMSGIMDKILLP
jgi:[FeFe] hydrogenase H-cluster maturation GTPase HydF